MANIEKARCILQDAQTMWEGKFGHIEEALAALSDKNQASSTRKFSIGQRVEKYTGDYTAIGEIRSVFETKNGAVRYVVQHNDGILHIYSAANLRALKEEKPEEVWTADGVSVHTNMGPEVIAICQGLIIGRDDDLSRSRALRIARLPILERAAKRVADAASALLKPGRTIWTQQYDPELGLDAQELKNAADTLRSILNQEDK